MKVEYLTLDDLLALAGDLGVARVRDLGLLDAAAHRPRSSLLGQDAYPSLHEKQLSLLESIVRNPSLADGNKRLGWMASFVFYGLNGVDLEGPEDDAYSTAKFGGVPRRRVEKCVLWTKTRCWRGTGLIPAVPVFRRSGTC